MVFQDKCLGASLLGGAAPRRPAEEKSGLPGPIALPALPERWAAVAVDAPPLS